MDCLKTLTELIGRRQKDPSELDDPKVFLDSYASFLNEDSPEEEIIQEETLRLIYSRGINLYQTIRHLKNSSQERLLTSLTSLTDQLELNHISSYLYAYPISCFLQALQISCDEVGWINPHNYAFTRDSSDIQILFLNQLRTLGQGYPTQNLKKDYLLEKDGTLTCYLGNSSFVIIPEGVRFLNCLFQESKDLQDIVLPNSLIELTPEAFAGCPSLRYVFFANSILKEIPESCFEEDAQLISFNLPAISSIQKNAFRNDISLKRIKIGSLTSLQESAFFNCQSLEIVDADRNQLTSIPSSCFQGCRSLNNFDFLFHAENYGENALEDTDLRGFDFAHHAYRKVNKNAFASDNYPDVFSLNLSESETIAPQAFKIKDNHIHTIDYLRLGYPSHLQVSNLSELFKDNLLSFNAYVRINHLILPAAADLHFLEGCHNIREVVPIDPNRQSIKEEPKKTPFRKLLDDWMMKQ
jgi:hypothetical protein